MTAPSLARDAEKAIAVLRHGGVIAMPTDTLYALAAAAGDAAAVRRVFAIKGREGAKALPLFVSSVAMAERVAVFNDAARRLVRRFWPGPLTVVLNKRGDFASEALGGGATVALRVPDHPTALAVIAGAGEPLTGTSANRSGGADPATPEEVVRQLDDAIDLLLDGGACPAGVSSTVVDCTVSPPRILRRGALSEDDIVAALSDAPTGTVR